MSARLPATTAAKAVENLPLTFIFMRPDGVEDRRIVSDGESARRPCASISTLQDNAMRGTWTVQIYTDPKEPPIAETDVPGRGFRARPHRVRPDERRRRRSPPASRPTITVDGRYLYGAPAAGLALEGEVVAQADARMRALPRLLLRPCRRGGEAKTTRMPLDGPAAARRGRQGDLRRCGRRAAVDDATAQRRRRRAHARSRRPRRRALADAAGQAGRRR